MSKAIPTYREALEYAAKRGGEENPKVVQAVCKILGIALPSMILKDLATVGEYLYGSGREPCIESRQSPSYQMAIARVDPANATEVMVVADLYRKRQITVILDAQQALAPANTLPTPKAARKSVTKQAPVQKTAVTPMAAAPTETVQAWRCGYCKVNLVAKEVWSHFDRLHRPDAG